MRITFREEFKLPIEKVFSYFDTPKDWATLYGLVGELKESEDGWYSIPLKNFPFPLVAKNINKTKNKHVHWIFKGFWKGEGVMDFYEENGLVTVEGHEDISVRWMFGFSKIVEKLILERQFRFIWNLGWKRLRKHEN